MSLGRRFRKIIFIILIIGGFIFNPNKAFLYTANPTHFNLAKEMVEFYNLNYDPDINSRQLEMILKGSIDEDTSPRYAFHLYDPIYNRAPFGVVTAKIWALDSNFQGDVIHAFANLLLNIFTKDDGEFQKHGDYSWSASVKYYNKGDADKAYYGLGHILHLIADMSVPAHSRNDHHITGDPLESWAGGINFSSDYNANLAENLYKDKRRPEMIYSTGQVFDELAKYSNEYFFSKDSIIGTDLYRDYNQPHNTVIKEEDYGHFSQRLYAWGVDEYDNPIRLLRVDTQESNWREISLLEEEKTVYRIDSNDAKLQTDYWTHLAPKAVQYGAGAIKLFLEETGKEVAISGSRAQILPGLPLIASIVSPLPSQPEVKGVSTEREEIETDEENKTKESDGTDPSTELGTSPSTESGISESNEQSGTVVSGPSLGGDGWSAAAQNQTPETASTSEVLEEPQDTTPPEFSFDYLNYNYASSSLSIGWSSLEADVVFDIEYKIGENDWQILMDNTASTQASLDVQEKDKIYFFRVRAIDKTGNENNWQEKSIAIVSAPIIINEVAWAGTEADSSDEWIELYNRSDFEINLSDWMLKIDDAEIILSGILSSKNYFLLERTDDEAISNIVADQIYAGALNNFGAQLILKDNNGNISDENNCGSGWCAGENRNEDGKWTRRTMERINPEKSGLLTENWRTYDGAAIGALDKENRPVLGTPKQQNSVYDVNPPAVISDLNVDYANGIFITLRWTAPLDEKTSGSMSYDIRYSEDQINEENWALAKPISDFAFSEKTPVVENPGTIQTVDITPLKFNTIYYFAIKTSDGLNISQLSNIIDYSAGAPPTLMKSIWPVFQKNQQSTGFVPYGGPGFISSESVTIRLVAELPNPIYVSFVMDTDGILYAGGEKGLYAIDSRNGELKWFYDTYNYERGWGGTSYSAVLASDGTVYFTFYGGTYLYALTPTGKLKWKYRVGGPNDGGSNPIIGSDGTIYVSGREQGYLYAINPDGTEKWKYLISGANVVSSPVMGSDETIYVAWRNFGFVGYVTAIDSEGNLRWQSENVNPDTYAGLSVDTNDNIYVGSNYYHVGYLRSLRPADGAENWSSAPWGRINVPANIDGNGVIYAVNESGNIFFLNPDRTLSGAIYVANQILKPIIIGVDGVIYLVSGKKIFAFYPDGTEKWSYEFTEEIMASPIIDESGTIYISTRDGKVWAIGE